MGEAKSQWGVCTTVKAPLAQILAFVAWHKHLGAARIWVHLDDADDVSAGILKQIDGVTPVLCNKSYWADLGGRPKRQEPRQALNVQRVYAQAEVPVLAHLDVDEFLWAERPIAAILDDWTDDTPFLRARPAEALHDAGLPDDIFTARQFRYPFPTPMPIADRYDVLGDYTALMMKGALSHKAGKSLFRTGVKGLVPKLHAASWEGQSDPIKLRLHPELTVLHFHAQNKAAWLAALPHRTTDGAYRFNEALAGFVADATAEEIDTFYAATQTATPAFIEKLRRHGLLLEADLGLKDKVSALF
ncbi:glycosyltransferase family 2 protein [Pseudooctadecabacter jejudonensis]|uniref:Glycosyl transferase family 2 n=1 Tax=Pseudooctadecabacter jejudonensis TaxID=1391910 RepID=A0A1Y5S261_9RHOB|nr:glycosyltransferase family 2 protein [Pseudooctadecabacter jejudonensis]SLN29563.1 hypothetical protein PSJ8397_01300 [Pseudooctadecabacter jejudonensis]